MLVDYSDNSESEYSSDDNNDIEYKLKYENKTKERFFNFII